MTAMEIRHYVRGKLGKSGWRERRLGEARSGESQER